MIGAKQRRRDSRRTFETNSYVLERNHARSKQKMETEKVKKKEIIGTKETGVNH